MSISTFVLSPPIEPQNSATFFIQSSLPGDIEAGIEAAVADIIALNAAIQDVANRYGLAAIDIAGGGDGFTFIVQLTFTTNAANTAYAAALGIQHPSDLITTDFHAGAYLAADATELPKHQHATYERLQAFDTQNNQFSVIGNSFAGASQGTRFMGVVVGFVGTP